jgi:peptidyl-dipeptidase A
MVKIPSSRIAVALLALVASSAEAQPKPATPEEAKAFVAKANTDLRELYIRSGVADWIRSTYITDDTEENAAWANDALLGYNSRAIKDATRFSSVKVDADTGRMLMLLRLSSAMPAPTDPKKRQQVASLAAKLEGIYGKGKWCGPDGKAPCQDLNTLSDTMSKHKSYDAQLEAWRGWHTISREMKPLYTEFVSLMNEGAKEIGFANTGELWKSNYDMSAADFEKDTDRLWEQVRPLYEDLHCYVRARLSKIYGADKVKPDGPIPAHLLGNMWAQEWNNIYDLVEPYKGQGSVDISKEMVKQKYDPIRMVKMGEGFFTSLGLKSLPPSFWTRSQFTKPRDREVVCHASAWDVHYNSDLRIKMCIQVNEEDLITIHHELGHNYYQTYYDQLPTLFMNGANDGFHEAIGDALTLSITPEYWKRMGLLKTVTVNPKSLINDQLKDALGKVAFLPFGLVVDRWRWDVFAGKTDPAHYNAAWWELRRKYQGLAPPTSRSEEDFDPGAKYHVPSNTPYSRYFVARILQFQFHRAMCQIAGHKGPLHTCSIYGNKEAGAKLRAMLEMGASKPWPDALAALTGQRTLDATALLDYFAPLRAWLQEQNKSQKCGW